MTRQTWPSQSRTWLTGLLTLAAGAAHPGTAASSAATITSTHIVLRFMWLPPPPTRGFRRLTLSSEGVAYIHDIIHGQKWTLKATPFLCLAETLMRVYDTPAGQGSPNLRIKDEEGRRFGWCQGGRKALWNPGGRCLGEREEEGAPSALEDGLAMPAAAG